MIYPFSRQLRNGEFIFILSVWTTKDNNIKLSFSVFNLVPVLFVGSVGVRKEKRSVVERKIIFIKIIYSQ